MAFILRKHCLQKHKGVHAHLMYKVTNFIPDNLHCTNAGQNHLSREGLLWNSIWKAFLSATSWLTSMPKEQRSVCSTNRWYTELHVRQHTSAQWIWTAGSRRARPEAAHLISSKDFIRSSRGHLQREADRKGYHVLKDLWNQTTIEYPANECGYSCTAHFTQAVYKPMWPSTQAHSIYVYIAYTYTL